MAKDSVKDPVKDISKKDGSKIRSFDAYLELVDNVESLIFPTDVTGKGSPLDSLPISDAKRLFAVIGFDISCEENRTPRAVVRLPIGSYLTNMTGRFGESVDRYGDSYKFRPVRTLGNVNTEAMKQEISKKISSKGAILWYRTLINDNDLDTEGNGAWKPIFKGIVTSQTFTRIAHQQESLNLIINHWAYLLDNVMFQNSLLHVSSDMDVTLPAIRRDEFMEKNFGGFSLTTSNDAARLSALGASGKEARLNSLIFLWMSHSAKCSGKWRPHLRGSLKNDVLDMYDNGIDFVQDLFEEMVDQHDELLAAGYTTDPTFNEKVLAPGKTAAFCFNDLVSVIANGMSNSMTYLQALNVIAANAGLTVVFTTNSITLEALTYSPRKWYFGPNERPPVDNVISIMSTKAFAREIVGFFAKGPTTSNFPGFSKDGVVETTFAHTYVDPAMFGADRQSASGEAYSRLALGSMVIVELPKWFNASIGSDHYEQYVKKDVASRSVRGDNLTTSGDGASGNQVGVDGSVLAEKMNNVSALLYQQLKSKNRNIIITLPFEINTCIGMPVCVKDSRNNLYYSGTIVRFDMKLSRDNNTAYTSWTIGNVDVFTHPGPDVPDENIKAYTSDTNPLFDIPAFKGRPIYR